MTTYLRFHKVKNTIKIKWLQSTVCGASLRNCFEAWLRFTVISPNTLERLTMKLTPIMHIDARITKLVLEFLNLNCSFKKFNFNKSSVLIGTKLLHFNGKKGEKEMQSQIEILKY